VDYVSITTIAYDRAECVMPGGREKEFKTFAVFRWSCYMSSGQERLQQAVANLVSAVAHAATEVDGALQYVCFWSEHS